MNNEKKKILILLVEDEKILVRTLEDRLVAEGFDVTKTFDGVQGLQMALLEHPDLILLDILMPNVDGLEMLKELRKDAWGSHATVIILTNVKDTDILAKGMGIGLDGVGNTYEYMVKTDWSLDAIVSRIKQRLNIAK